MDFDEKQEREERAARLRWAREQSDFRGPTSVADALGIPVDTYKAYEQGRNGFGTAVGRALAELFGVSYKWLYLNEGLPEDANEPIGLGSKYREIIAIYDKLPPDLQESYADVLRKLAAPYQPQSLPEERTPAKTKPT